MKIQIVNFLSFVATISQASAIDERLQEDKTNKNHHNLRRQQQECRALGDRCSNGKPCCDSLACTDGRCAATTTPNPTPLPTTSPTPNPTFGEPTSSPTTTNPTLSPTSVSKQLSYYYIIICVAYEYLKSSFAPYTSTHTLTSYV